MLEMIKMYSLSSYLSFYVKDDGILESLRTAPKINLSKNKGELSASIESNTIPIPARN